METYCESIGLWYCDKKGKQYIRYKTKTGQEVKSSLGIMIPMSIYVDDLTGGKSRASGNRPISKGLQKVSSGPNPAKITSLNVHFNVPVATRLSKFSLINHADNRIRLYGLILGW